MVDRQYREERDSMGTLKVPVDALWGAQTQRALNNFKISGLCMPRGFVRALGLIKWAGAKANGSLGLLAPEIADAIQAAAETVIAGDVDQHFPIDVFQTGSGTSTNMNTNEVIARIASQATDLSIHPNDHVNMGQSSNDVIPTALHLSAAMAVHEDLIPNLHNLQEVTVAKAESLKGIVKTGRTHLMDAMPVGLDQEVGAWAAQVQQCIDRISTVLPRLHRLAQGGTAVGTGINAHEDFGQRIAELLSQRLGFQLSPADNLFVALSCQDTAVELSGQLKTLAVTVTKIANDLRWMNSGPLAGFAEIALPALQPGSSIMPGKVNPVIPEAAAMACAQVIGNDATITVAGQSGNFQLNVMLPVIAYNLLQSIQIMNEVARALAEQAIDGFSVKRENIEEALSRNPILVTALNPIIGYEAGAAIAKKAYQEGRSVLEVALEETDLTEADLKRLLDPEVLIRGGIHAKP